MGCDGVQYAEKSDCSVYAVGHERFSDGPGFDGDQGGYLPEDRNECERKRKRA